MKQRIVQALPQPCPDGASGRRRDVWEVDEKPLGRVILSVAKNPSICGIKQIQRSFVAYGSSG
jgi:hypothetical protein